MLRKANLGSERPYPTLKPNPILGSSDPRIAIECPPKTLKYVDGDFEKSANDRSSIACDEVAKRKPKITAFRFERMILLRLGLGPNLRIGTLVGYL